MKKEIEEMIGRLNTSVRNPWRDYEAAKLLIGYMAESPLEYEAAILKLAEKLGV
jgi:hypothetical protein